MNNLEFDHADIFDDLEQIQRQFHHLVRTVPSGGLIVSPLNDGALHEVLDEGCWTPVEHFDPGMEATWHVTSTTADGSGFDVICEGANVGRVAWPLTGMHNVSNALGALAAARHAGVPAHVGVAALSRFTNVKRRMELCGEVHGVRVYDDFAHHPTAIELTLQGLRAQVGDGRILAILEPRSNTMRRGVHAAQLPAALSPADHTWVFTPDDLDWNAVSVLSPLGTKVTIVSDVQEIIDDVGAMAASGDQVVIMSNGGFAGIHERLLVALDQAVAHA